MTPTPWQRCMDMYQAAEELHVGLYDIARWVTEGKLRSRIPDKETRPSVWNVEVCEIDVRKWRKSGHVTPYSVDDPQWDEFRAQSVLRRRRGGTWPPRAWLAAREGIRRSNPRSHPSSRRMGRTETEQVNEVIAMVKRLGDEFGWVSLAVVCRRLAKRAWAQDSTVVRDIVDMLLNTAEFEEQTVRPRMGRPSYQIRLNRESGREKA